MSADELPPHLRAIARTQEAEPPSEAQVISDLGFKSIGDFLHFFGLKMGTEQERSESHLIFRILRAPDTEAQRRALQKAMKDALIATQSDALDRGDTRTRDPGLPPQDLHVPEQKQAGLAFDGAVAIRKTWIKGEPQSTDGQPASTAIKLGAAGEQSTSTTAVGQVDGPKSPDASDRQDGLNKQRLQGLDAQVYNWYNNESDEEEGEVAGGKFYTEAGSYDAESNYFWQEEDDGWKG
ncbi:hypothetical protein JX266_006455 [Neoarthrinium moseri]|nr:hypothetical protein JX266_006455 [Neoarthrinium moseri]